MVKEIPLQNGMVALVDDEDYERVNKYNWTLSNSSNNTSLVVYSNKVGSLNCFIMNGDKGDLFIHKNRDPLNFQKENIKKVNVAERTRFRRGDKNSSSKYKGVSWRKDRNKWCADITFDKKRIFIGYFDSEDEAATAYNQASIEFFGEYGYLNLIGQDNNAKDLDVDTKITEKRVVQFKRSCKLPKSGLRGVIAKNSGWAAYVRKGGNSKHIGMFNSAEQAAKAYDRKAYELYGDKAILNFPELIDEYKKALKEVKPITIKPVPVALVSQAINKAISARQK